MFSNQETEDLVDWLLHNLTGAGLQELLRQGPRASVDTPVENLGYRLRQIFMQILPPHLQTEWLDRVNWIEAAAYLMNVYDVS